ncbi:MAG: tetratricopeptide repeat protein [Bdellovibrionia bacterium]
MKKNSYLFVIACLLTAIFSLGAYSIFLNYFGQGHELQARLRLLEESVEAEKNRNNLLSFQVKDLQQTVALAFPDDKKLLAKLNEPARGLASSLRLPASENQLDLSGVLLEKGKTAFQRKNYDVAIKNFNQLIAEYPLSGYVVSARFFKIESLFHKKDYKECLSQIDELLQLYPEHEMSGFALMRMAMISEGNGQLEEAKEISRTVLKNFDHPFLHEQAKRILQEGVSN